MRKEMKNFLIILTFLAIFTFFVSYSLENKYNITGQVFRTFNTEKPTIDSCASQNVFLQNNNYYDLTLNVYSQEDICINITNKENITVDLKDHIIYGKQEFPAIYIKNSNNVTFLGGYIFNSSNAINIVDSENINIDSTIVENTSVEGIKIENSESIHLKNITYDNKNLGDLMQSENWDDILLSSVNNPNTISVSGDGTKILLSSFQERLYFSNDSGNSWEENNLALNWSSTSMNDNGSIMLASVYGGRIYSSEDYGNSWDALGSDNKSWVSVGIPKQAESIIGLEGGGKIYKYNGTDFENVTSTNQNWQDLTITGSYNIIYAVASGDHIYKSVNAGDSFYNITNDTKLWSDISMSWDGDIILAVENGGRVYLSNDSGASFEEVRPAGDVNRNWNTSFVSKGGEKMIVGDDTEVYFSSNSGQDWVEIGPLGDVDVSWSSSYVNDNNLYLLRLNEALYKYSKKGLLLDNTNNSLIENIYFYNFGEAFRLIGDSNNNIIKNPMISDVLYSIKDLTGGSYENYLEFSNDYGKFTWSAESINQDLTIQKEFDITNPRHMSLSQDNIYVNDSYYDVFNNSINLTFNRDDDWQDYIFILKNGETCMPNCVEYFRNSSEISYTTSSLGDFSIHGPIFISGCQEQGFFEDYRFYLLNQDVYNFDSNQNCFIIEDNSNITLDLGSHTVYSTHSSSGNGVLILRSEGINVRDGTLINFTQGVKIEDSKNNFVENLSLDKNRKHGVLLYDTISDTQNNILSNLDFINNSETSIKDDTPTDNLNYLIYNNSYGTVEWDNLSLQQNLTFEDNFLIGKNVLIKPSNIYLNFSQVDSKLNTTLNLTFYNVGTDHYKRNNETCEICEDLEIGLDIATIKFNTTDDGNYTVEEIGYIGSCGYSNWFNGGKYIINQSIEVGDSFCFNITNNNILFDMNDTVFNSTSYQSGIGIITNKSNITIFNGSFKNFNSSLVFEDASNIDLHDLNFENNTNDIIISNTSNLTLKDSMVNQTYNNILKSTLSELLNITNIHIFNYLGSSNNLIELSQTINSSLLNIYFSDETSDNTFVYFDDVNNSLISNLNLNNISSVGLHLNNSNNNQLQDINLVEKRFDENTGLVLENSDSNLLSSLSFSNLSYSFNLTNSNENIIYELDIINPKLIGISLLNLINNTFYDVTFSNQEYEGNLAFSLLNSSFNQLNSTDISSLTNGIYLDIDSESNKIINLNSVVNNYSILDESGSGNINELIYSNSYGNLKWIDNSVLNNLTLFENITFPGLISIGELQVNISSVLDKLNSTIKISLRNTRGYTDLIHFNLTKNNQVDLESEIIDINVNNIIFNSSTIGDFLIKDTIVDTTLDSCQEILLPNREYELVSDINSDVDNCFVINANNVKLLGKNKELTGTSGVGIYVNASNVTLEGFDLINDFENAIYLSSYAINTTIKNLYSDNVSYSILDESGSENKNYIFYDSGESSITWSNETFFENISVVGEISKGDIVLEDFFVFLNSSKLTDLDQEAILGFDLWNDLVLNLVLLKDGSSCNSGTCSESSNEGGLLLINVNDWGNISFTGCGNRILEGDEQCDYNIFEEDKTCFDYGFNSGDLDCYNNCTIDTSDCETVDDEIGAPSSGGGTVTPPPTDDQNDTSDEDDDTPVPSDNDDNEDDNLTPTDPEKQFKFNTSLIIRISVGILVLLILIVVVIMIKKKKINKKGTTQQNSKASNRKPIVLSPPRAPQSKSSPSQQQNRPSQNQVNRRMPPRSNNRFRQRRSMNIPASKINNIPKPKPIIDDKEDKKTLTNEEIEKNRENDIKVKQKIKDLLLLGVSQIKAKQIDNAIQTYKKINEEYQNMSEHHDSVYDTVVEFYKRILDLKK